MDIELHYIKKGAGAPLLLLHGNGEDGSYFVHQMDAFSLHYTVYAIDTRGHGRSPRGNAPFTMEQFARDLLEFMDEEAIQKANILGFSDGGEYRPDLRSGPPGAGRPAYPQRGQSGPFRGEAPHTDPHRAGVRRRLPLCTGEP